MNPQIEMFGFASFPIGLHEMKRGEMSVKIQDVLEQDEVVVLHSRLKPRDLVWRIVVNVFLLAIIIYGMIGIFYLAGFMRPNLVKIFILSYTYYFIPIVALLLIYFELSKGEAVVTNRRLLRRDGLFKPRITKLSLSNVKHVHGLTESAPVSVESKDGALIPLRYLPHAREIGWAVAQASGLKLPTGPVRVSWSRKQGT